MHLFLWRIQITGSFFIYQRAGILKIFAASDCKIPVSVNYFPYSGCCIFWIAFLCCKFYQMSSKPTTHNRMRIYHRYLGFFLAGIMAMYAISGTILIFRDTDFLKREKLVKEQLKPGLTADELGKAIRKRDLKIDSVSGDMQLFKGGSYNKQTGAVSYTNKSLQPFAEKLTHLHKASTKEPLFFIYSLLLSVLTKDKVFRLENGLSH